MRSAKGSAVKNHPGVVFLRSEPPVGFQNRLGLSLPLPLTPGMPEPHFRHAAGRMCWKGRSPWRGSRQDPIKRCPDQAYGDGALVSSLLGRFPGGKRLRGGRFPLAFCHVHNDYGSTADYQQTAKNVHPGWLLAEEDERKKGGGYRVDVRDNPQVLGFYPVGQAPFPSVLGSSEPPKGARTARITTDS